ncbi:MAG: hypothetical protein KC592_02810 [Nitrospira sp.]|nr:hypothetical protein [Nitrospira sp.]
MSHIDLKKVEAAMNWLAETSEGVQTIALLADSCDAVQARIPVPVNNAEMRYILERLMSQRDIYDNSVGNVNRPSSGAASYDCNVNRPNVGDRQPYSGAASYGRPDSSATYQPQTGYGAFSPYQTGTLRGTDQLRALPRGFRVRAVA